MFFDEAEKGVTELSAASRWPVNNQQHLLIFQDKNDLSRP
jgi:hypothetical protein